jgi:DNA modification methylase
LGHGGFEMVRILHGDALTILKTLSDESVNCCVTSPPYWGLRDYGVEGQLGLERTPEEYVAKMVEVFREVKRVLRDDGTLWLNLGDSYCGSNGNRNAACTDDNWKRGGHIENGYKKPQSIIEGLKPKDLVGIPWMVAFALRADGWYLRQDIIWKKPNPMPESVTDRCTKAHEYIFLMSKSQRYFYDAAAIAEDVVNEKWKFDGAKRIERVAATGGAISGGTGDVVSGGPTRNKRSVWTVSTAPFPGAHFATFPPKLIEPCILAGCPIGGTVLDCFGGSGTVGMVAENNGRNSILIELNQKYCEMAKKKDCTNKFIL